MYTLKKPAVAPQDNPERETMEASVASVKSLVFIYRLHIKIGPLLTSHYFASYSSKNQYAKERPKQQS